MTANHEHTPTDEEMQELFETGAMVTEFAHSRQEATIDWQLWLQERDARIEAAAEQRGLERGWDEGHKSGLDTGLTIGEITHGIKPGPIPGPQQNPYRAAQMEGDDV